MQRNNEHSLVGSNSISSTPNQSNSKSRHPHNVDYSIKEPSIGHRIDNTLKRNSFDNDSSSAKKQMNSHHSRHLSSTSSHNSHRNSAAAAAAAAAFASKSILLFLFN